MCVVLNKMKRYQNSYCKKKGWLHKFNVVRQSDKGVLERCERCGENKNFPVNTPNHIYLSYHIRNILRADDPLFAREYPQIKV